MAESAPDDGSPPQEQEPGSDGPSPTEETPAPSSPTGATPVEEKPLLGPPAAKAEAVAGPPAPETPQEKKAREFIAQAEKKIKSSQTFFGGLFG